MQLLLNSAFNSYMELISVLLIFVFVLFITWFATRYMANFQKTKYANHNMKVIETIQVGSNKYLSLVEVGEEYLVVSIGKDEVNLITKLTKEQLPNVDKVLESSGTESFEGILAKMKDKFPKK